MDDEAHCVFTPSFWGVTDSSLFQSERSLMEEINQGISEANVNADENLNRLLYLHYFPFLRRKKPLVM